MISTKIKRFEPGVYQIKNLINNKTYIGSSVNIYNRKHTHINKLRTKIHSSKHLQNAYHKYGPNNFLFTVLEYCKREEITSKEQFWIDALKPEYNKRKNAQNNLGQKLSKVSIEKMRNSLLRGYKSGKIKTYRQNHLWTPIDVYSLDGIKKSEFDCVTDFTRSIGCKSNAQGFRVLNKISWHIKGYVIVRRNEKFNRLKVEFIKPPSSQSTPIKHIPSGRNFASLADCHKIMKISNRKISKESKKLQWIKT